MNKDPARGLWSVMILTGDKSLGSYRGYIGILSRGLLGFKWAPQQEACNLGFIVGLLILFDVAFLSKCYCG